MNDDTPCATLAELAERWTGERCPGCGGQIRDRWTLHFGGCPMLVADEVVTTAVMKTATGPDVSEIVCPECSGVSRFRHRDGRSGGFAYLTHRSGVPESGCLGGLSWPQAGVNHRGSVMGTRRARTWPVMSCCVAGSGVGPFTSCG